MSISRRRCPSGGWTQWQHLINSGEYEAARPMFANDVVAFGTVTSMMSGLADLESRQWREVWYRIKDFQFDKETAQTFLDPSAGMAVICCLWHSFGKTKTSWYERRGRVTLVLRAAEGGLCCVHTISRWNPNSARCRRG